MAESRNNMNIINRTICLVLIFILAESATDISIADDLTNIPVSTPIDTDSAGRGGNVAVQSVLRIICIQHNSAGTGFVHKSGNIITAEHVVRGCPQPTIILPNGTTSVASVIATDQDYDLALVKPSAPIEAMPLSVSARNNFAVGTQVSTWGFPGGYTGVTPLLSVGYLSGADASRTGSGKIIRQWVVNAAFNGGNSGGPLIHIETGEVIGVVSSKLAPISQDTAAILQLLEKQHSGFTYSGTKPDGTAVTFTEGQLIGMVLNELRGQVQLVIGKAVFLEDLITFLKSQKIEP
jgi:S1-C subfamily serine protease